jgi:hypothetical protein
MTMETISHEKNVMYDLQRSNTTDEQQVISCPDEITQGSTISTYSNQSSF